MGNLIQFSKTVFFAGETNSSLTFWGCFSIFLGAE